MKEQIKQLIQQHKQAKEEVWGCLNELSQFDEDKMSKEEVDTLEKVKSRYSEEYVWRGVFISQLEDLL